MSGYVKLTKRQGDLLRFVVAGGSRGVEIGAIKRSGFSMQNVESLEMRHFVVKDAVTGRMRAVGPKYLTKAELA